VIHRRVTANEVVAANLYILGGTSHVPVEKAGTELLLLETSERGTRKYPRMELERKMARLGSAIATGPSLDWTMFALRSTTATFDSTWAIFADRLMAPRLDSADVTYVKTQLLSAIAQRADDPDNLLDHLTDSVAFAGHPYGIAPEGTAATVRRLTAADLRAWHRTQFTTSRMLLVVVGDLPREKVEALVRRTIATLPKGTYTWKAPPAPAQRAGTLHTVERSLPTNYFKGYWPGPRADSPDYQPMRIAMAALGGRLFSEVRVRRNLTYAVEAPFEEKAYGVPGLYVTTTQPDSVLTLMRREVTSLKRGTIDPTGLQLLVQQFITEFFLDNETNSDQATFLARSQLYRGDWRTSERFVDELRRVTPEDIQRVSRQYLVGLVAGYVGDPSRISAGRVAGF
jgi:zinc protease